LGFLVVADLVLFLGSGLGEGEELEGLGLSIEANDGWIMVRGVASVMISEGCGKGTEVFSVTLGVVVVAFDGDDLVGEVFGEEIC
jgi:hypothetical protein